MYPKVVEKWSKKEWEAMRYVMNKENRNANQYAVNSIGACGIPQALPCSKMLNVIGSLDNLDGQLDWMVNYISKRYGTPTKAMQFHKINNWY